ncbi:peptidoglycan recognition protein [Streptomyces sp. NBC_01498]|uniref:peptidoglycan recognition protein family protein n=1 Tax=Streptomyces sp. NBC_01498 TaxID=2975870 RepID=UPI002E7BFDED|nr:peptidoglycan recognition protein [Streptomyces sp. NBC_01498]WTL23887.1 peptidoglycan recognition protein [Streptomyces sp. NBC_01498]
MNIDRRVLLRGVGWATAAGAGLGLAADAAVRAGEDGPGPHLRSRTRARPEGELRWSSEPPAVEPRTFWQEKPPPRRTPERTATEVKAVFIHHTSSPNDYTRPEVPALIRNFAVDHVDNRQWDDIGYNFLVDRGGVIYEGRVGGIANPVVGAHTLGFNVATMGIAAIGDFSDGTPVPEPMVDALARLIAWKLGLYGVDPRGTTTLTSTNDGSRYKKGTRQIFRTVSGHRDGYSTHCPGGALYGALPRIRERAARLQGRPDR